MDFFNDDFGFADVPHLKQNKSVTKYLLTYVERKIKTNPEEE